MGKSSYSTQRSRKPKYICDSSEILLDQTCHSLSWFDGKRQTQKLAIHKCLLAGKQTTITPTPNLFETILLSVAVPSMQFIFWDQAVSEQSTVFMVDKIWLFIYKRVQLVERQWAQGWYSCEAKGQIPNLVWGNIFHCKCGYLVSSVSVWNHVNDCEDGNDETVMFPAGTTHLEGISNCSPLQYVSIEGHCETFTVSKHQEVEVQNTGGDIFQCSNLTNISSSLVGDLIPDCGESAEDEALYNQVLTNRIFRECHNPDEIPCVRGFPLCYKFRDICIYKLNVLQYLVPCRTGSHLYDCSSFECNYNFKCSKSYCIKNTYICDGKWDCPNGYDETEDHSCSSTQNCTTQFKCKYSSRCIHVYDVCDGEEDCPSGDDEILCQIKYMLCPTQCGCLNLAIVCANAHFHKLSMNTVPSVSQIYLNSSFQTLNILHKCLNILYLKFVSSGMINLCNVLNYFQMIIEITLVNNEIPHLRTMCFSSMPSLSLLNLSDNEIDRIEACAFHNLTNVQGIDLSKNKLLSVSPIFFSQASNIRILNLDHNTLMDTNNFLFLPVQVVIHKEFRVCCSFPKDVTCTAVKWWFSSCNKLLLNENIALTCIMVVTLLWLFNGASLSLKLFNILKRHQKTAHYMFSISADLVHFLAGVSPLLLWAGHKHHGEKFSIEESTWQTSLPCLSSFVSTTIFSVLSNSTSITLSLAILMVTIFPFTSRFKSWNFVAKLLLFKFFFVSILFSSLTAFSVLTVTNSLCSPFVDYSQAFLQQKCFTLLILFAEIVSLFSCFSVVRYVSQIEAKLTNLKLKHKQKSRMKMPSLVFPVCIRCACSIPTCTMFLTCLLSNIQSVELILWTTVLLWPLSSVLHPFTAVVSQGVKTTNRATKTNSISKGSESSLQTSGDMWLFQRDFSWTYYVTTSFCLHTSRIEFSEFSQSSVTMDQSSLKQKCLTEVVVQQIYVPQ